MKTSKKIGRGCSNHALKLFFLKIISISSHVPHIHTRNDRNSNIFHNKVCTLDMPDKSPPDSAHKQVEDKVVSQSQMMEGANIQQDSHLDPQSLHTHLTINQTPNKEQSKKFSYQSSLIV
ncbi:MAG: hypothetical protein WCC74_01310 [Minisyncoccia bacterium]